MTDLTGKTAGSARFATLVLLFVAAFALYGMYCLGTINQIKVNGPFYSRIVQGKDVIADILPPPAYLVESYLIAFQMLDNGDAEFPKLLVSFTGRKDEYEARHAHWQAALAEGDLKRELVESSYLPGRRMLDTIEKSYIPALQSGDRALAERLLRGPIKADYAAHRAAIERVVGLAKERNREDEAGAALAVRSRVWGQAGLGLVFILLLSGLSWRWVRDRPRPMEGAVAGTTV